MSALPMRPLEPRGPAGIWTGYTKEPWALGGYSALVAAYLAAGSALLYAAVKANRIPERIKSRDIFLLGIATHKLTRIITKDWVTSPLRAPWSRIVLAKPQHTVSGEAQRGRPQSPHVALAG